MVTNLNCDGIRQVIAVLDSLGASAQANNLKIELQECSEFLADENQPTSVTDLPPLIIRGLNFANAIAKHTANGFKRRSQVEINDRLAICQACPQFADNHCRVCGCPCVEANQLLNKLALASETCPLGKWK